MGWSGDVRSGELALFEVGTFPFRRFLRCRWPADPALPGGVILDLSAALGAIPKKDVIRGGSWPVVWQVG